MEKIFIKHIAKKYNYTYHEALYFYNNNCFVNNNNKDWKRIAKLILS
jgi:hypothetical protein